jgi:hypothetical protein
MPSVKATPYKMTLWVPVLSDEGETGGVALWHCARLQKAEAWEALAQLHTRGADQSLAGKTPAGRIAHLRREGFHLVSAAARLVASPHT